MKTQPWYYGPIKIGKIVFWRDVWSYKLNMPYLTLEFFPFDWKVGGSFRLDRYGFMVGIRLGLAIYIEICWPKAWRPNHSNLR